MKILFISLLVLVFTGTRERKSEVHDFSVIKVSEWVIPRNDTLDYAFGEHLGQKGAFNETKNRKL